MNDYSCLAATLNVPATLNPCARDCVHFAGGNQHSRDVDPVMLNTSARVFLDNLSNGRLDGDHLYQATGTTLSEPTTKNIYA